MSNITQSLYGRSFMKTKARMATALSLGNGDGRHDLILPPYPATATGVLGARRLPRCGYEIEA